MDAVVAVCLAVWLLGGFSTYTALRYEVRPYQDWVRAVLWPFSPFLIIAAALEDFVNDRRKAARRKARR